MKTELISIIVPAYNVENHVQKTIESLLSQTYQNIEIICVDDGSKDHTLDVLQALAEKDGRIKCLHKENAGVTKARQFGIEHAKGEYIGFVDADDILEPDMYERLYVNLKKYQTDISHCGYVIDHPDGSHEFFYNTGRLVRQNKTEGIVSLVSGDFEPGLWNKLYKQSLFSNLLQGDVMDYSIKMNEDVLMNYYLFKEAESSVFKDICLYHYVKREGSATMSGFKKSDTLDRLKVKRIIYEDAIGTDYEETAKRAYLEKFIHSYNAFLTQNRPEYEEDMRQIRQELIRHKNEVKLLSAKYRVTARILMVSPRLYSYVHRLLKS
ncbi:MAG: glycosyltransferase family 2 protein [Clostridia bacterium]|nr:glycosyltransferase family 2 protein [Clostridia bacterium]